MGELFGHSQPSSFSLTLSLRRNFLSLAPVVTRTPSDLIRPPASLSHARDGGGFGLPIWWWGLGYGVAGVVVVAVGGLLVDGFVLRVCGFGGGDGNGDGGGGGGSFGFGFGLGWKNGGGWSVGGWVCVVGLGSMRVGCCRGFGFREGGGGVDLVAMSVKASCITNSVPIKAARWWLIRWWLGLAGDSVVVVDLVDSFDSVDSVIFSDLYSQSTSPLPTRDPPHGHGLRRYPPAGENHPTAKPGRERPTPRSRPGRERPTPRPGLAVPDPNGLEVTRADLGLASPSSPNEFELAKKGSPEVELGLEVVEPCRLVAEKILVAEINLK
uniref:Uncharacterized protein n=1 Tax=Fagus sylvatica TaxID=28930 RepID=A0A2N9I184_FAGSY